MSLPEKQTTQWQKGQSGNPGGRPRGVPKISNALLRILAAAPGEIPEARHNSDVIAQRLFESARQGDTWAAREVLERSEGKVSQALQLSATQLPTSEIVDRLVAAFTEAGLQEAQTRKVLLLLASSDDE